ncbi:hypothetical protein J1N35_039633 [Gossypium stocksii]|uniref:Uncharacterized protein n=1 Tax=Gossypium stocksii TaxID=47602 RepID=A0A9D3UC42_9ROSI|nr:hypothetical protein J1N35_039633 [Gossypium stocksii]
MRFCHNNSDNDEEKEVSDVEPIETNPTNEEIAPKAPEKEPKKIEFASIETDCEDEEEANASVVPLVDSTVAIPPPFTVPMTEQDREIN